MKFLSVILIVSIPLFVFSQLPEKQPVDKLDSPFTGIINGDGYSPKFPGGDSGYIKFLKENLHYPKNEWRNGKEGVVFVALIIEEDGRVSKMKIVRNVSPAIDSEAVRVMRLSPRWVPGRQYSLKHGQWGPSVMSYTVAFRFKIHPGRKIEDAFKEPYYYKPY